MRTYSGTKLYPRVRCSLRPGPACLGSSVRASKSLSGVRQQLRSLDEPYQLILFTDSSRSLFLMAESLAEKTNMTEVIQICYCVHLVSSRVGCARRVRNVHSHGKFSVEHDLEHFLSVCQNPAGSTSLIACSVKLDANTTHQEPKLSPRWANLFNWPLDAAAA